MLSTFSSPPIVPSSLPTISSAWLLSLVTILSGFEINNFAGQPGKVSLL
jgi:hypothetical protein